MSIRIHQGLANSNSVKKFVNWATKNDAANYKKLQKYYPTAFMLLTIGIGQTGFILASDDMPKKRRIPLALNNTINCIISLAGGIITDKYVDKLTDTFVKRAEATLVCKEKEQVIKGIGRGIPILVSGLLYKYIGPVLATPLTDKVNKFLEKHKMVDYSKE